jgi:CheY-like chemotaxis protein
MSSAMTERTLLYIDDREDNLMLVERLLRRRPDLQLRLRCVQTGRDGVKAATEDPPALILLDNRLPDADGKQILRQLAASPATAVIPVVIVSGDSAQPTIDDLLSAGAAGYLTKPFDIHDLLAMLERHLA